MQIPQTAWSAPCRQYPSVHSGCQLSPGRSQNYSNNSQRNIANDNKIGERVDFNNQKTGQLVVVLPLRQFEREQRLCPASPSVPGFPTVTPTRAQQFVMSNTKTLGPTAVNEARITFFRNALALGQPGRQFRAVSRSLGFVTGAGTLGIIPLCRISKSMCLRLNFNNSGLNIGVPTLNTFQPNNTYMVIRRILKDRWASTP